MSDTAPAETALAWLRRQLADLSELRNATTRDAQFKLWRQNTLTVVQRIWPGVTERSQRFRRVPFSPASNRAGNRETRECFERGCAEAGDLLLLWIQEIETHGVRHEPAMATPASESMADFATTVDLDQPSSPERPVRMKEEIPTLDLPEIQPKRRRAARKPKRWAEAVQAGPVAKAGKEKSGTSTKGKRTKRRTSAKAKPRLKDMLGFGHLSAAQGGRDHTQFEDEVEPTPPVDGPEITARQTEPPPAPTQLHVPEPLKLEIPEPQPTKVELPKFEPLDHPEVTSEPPKVDPASNPFQLKFPGPEFPGPEPTRVETKGEPFEAEAFRIESSAVVESERLDADAEPDPELLLPIVSIEPARVMAPIAAMPFIPDSIGSGAFGPGTAPIAALASELDYFEIPAADRAALRRFLIDLALRLESRSCGWVDLRAAVVKVMEYPALARRALPVLIPFLDRVA